MMACTSGFDQSKADEILGKESLTPKEYSELIKLYETGMDDAIEFSQKEAQELSEENRKEVMTIFAIGMRLSKDEENLSESQKADFERINQKGTDNLTK